MVEKINKRLQKESLFYEVWEEEINGENFIVILVEWGDWKHDHIYLDHIMREMDFSLIGEIVTEEDGSDTYSSKHVYVQQKR